MLLTITQVCDRVAIKRTLCYKMIGSGELEAVKIGTRTLITQRSVEALIERGIATAKALRRI